MNELRLSFKTIKALNDLRNTYNAVTNTTFSESQIVDFLVQREYSLTKEVSDEKYIRMSSYAKLARLAKKKRAAEHKPINKFASKYEKRSS